jgi:hypothetical protein
LGYVTTQGDILRTNRLRLAAAPVTTPHALNIRYFGPDCRAAFDR